MIRRLIATAVTTIAMVTALVVMPGNLSAWTWSGEVRAYDHTTHTVLTQPGGYGTPFVAPLWTSVNFMPEGVGPNAHHYTVILKRMDNGQMMYYKTMLNQWAMEHFSYTVWQTGDYWMQVNAYQANGTGAGAYKGILTVKPVEY